MQKVIETVHGQHQAVDKSGNITVPTDCRRPQSLKGNCQSSVGANVKKKQSMLVTLLVENAAGSFSSVEAIAQ